MREFAKRRMRRIRDFLAAPVLDRIDTTLRAIRDNHRADAVAQIQLQLTYRRLFDDGLPLPKVADVGFKRYSQSDEDGILLFLFSVLGASKKTCVEICAGDGIECNTANLIVNHGWHGLLVDGDERRVARGRQFYEQSPFTWVYPPSFVCAWVTREGVNGILRDAGFTGEIDLLSIDLDGVDYWIWQAIDVITPRVVVVEYQDILGPDREWSVPYVDQFSPGQYPSSRGMPNFAGASLAAFVKLGRRKGYRLVGVNRYGYNAFFVKNGLGDAHFPEIAPSTCFSHPKAIWGMRERFPTVANLPWEEV